MVAWIGHSDFDGVICKICIKVNVLFTSHSDKAVVKVFFKNRKWAWSLIIIPGS